MRNHLAVLSAIVLMSIPAMAEAQSTTIILDWTAPGDDADSGTASSYQLHFATVQPDTTSQSEMDSWWASSTNYPGMPAPQVAGSLESVTVNPSPAFQTGQTYYFVMIACDEVPNCSAYSNVASKFLADIIGPAQITDLFAR